MADTAQVVLVAERGGRVLGFLHATREEGPGDLVRAPWCCLAILVVDRAARHRGIGTVLVRAAEAWAARGRMTALQLGVHEFNRGAIRFYERLGYRPVMRLMQKSPRAR
ncbi:MAG: GNAT family N-acetyltransferase [Planctomycetia bacterium]|nr:GNAT family N-acetyltransferase [Planctomycetia bacterium]